MKRLPVLFLLFLSALACANADELAVGAKAPAFALVNATDGKNVAFHPGDGKVSVVIFTCNQCPYAKAFEPRIIELAKQYQAKGVVFYAIDPNDEAQYAVESLAEMKARATEKGYPFPYLKDGDSSIAHAYGARHAARLRDRRRRHAPLSRLRRRQRQAGRAPHHRPDQRARRSAQRQGGSESEHASVRLHHQVEGVIGATSQAARFARSRPPVGRDRSVSTDRRRSRFVSPAMLETPTAR